MGTTMQTITPQELVELLNSKDHSGVVDRKDEPVFTKQELDTLLDRSDLTWEKISKEQNLINKKQNTSFGVKSFENNKRFIGTARGEKVKSTISTNHFKVIDTEGIPQGLPSVKED